MFIVIDGRKLNGKKSVLQQLSRNEFVRRRAWTLVGLQYTSECNGLLRLLSSTRVYIYIYIYTRDDCANVTI